MFSQFQQLNIHAYYTLVGVFLDFVIWCLGPLVDEEKDYSLARYYLAAVTCRICRSWLTRRGWITESD